MSVHNQKINKPLKDESIIQRQDVTLSIEISENPASKPEWYFNNKPRTTNDQQLLHQKKEEIEMNWK